MQGSRGIRRTLAGARHEPGMVACRTACHVFGPLAHGRNIGCRTQRRRDQTLCASGRAYGRQTNQGLPKEVQNSSENACQGVR